MRFKVFLVFLLLFSTVCGFSQEQDWYIGKPINDIQFTGIKNVTMSELESLISPYKGRVYNDNVYTEILTKLFALNYFLNIDINPQQADGGSKVNLICKVTEFPVVNRIIFSGNSALDEAIFQTL